MEEYHPFGVQLIPVGTSSIVMTRLRRSGDSRELGNCIEKPEGK